MKYEQRLLLALGLTTAILIFWSVLSPPSQPPQIKPPSPRQEMQLARRASLIEETERFSLGSAEFGIGSQSGGIVDLRLDGTQLLLGSEPGFLQVEWAKSSTNMLNFANKWVNSSISSYSDRDKNGISVTRKIFQDQENSRSNFLYQCQLSIKNLSTVSGSYGLRLAAYRSLHIASPEDRRYESGIVRIGTKTEEVPLRPRRPVTFDGEPAWITSQGKSHALVVQPDYPVGLFHVEQSSEGVTTGWLELPEVELVPGNEVTWNFRIYAGPIDLDLLRQVGLEDTISFGMFSEVARWLLGFMDWSHGWVHNYGLSICLLSFGVWLLMSPITFYGTWLSSTTMEKMARVKPQEGRIRKEYAKNPQKMQQEVMQLYRKHGVNPATGCIGCLPLLFTWPIFIALFQVLNRAPQLRGAKFLWITDLSAPDALFSFPRAVPLIGESFNLLPILATVAMYFQQKSMQKTQSVAMTEEQKIQQKIFAFFPIMLLIFFYKLPSGFMLYWVIYSGLMAGQQSLVQKLVKTRSPVAH